MKHFAILISLLIAITSSSCGGPSANASTAAATSPAEAAKMAVAEAAAAKSAPSTAAKLPAKATSAEQLINYMKNSGDWDKYSKGIIPSIARQSVEYAEKLLHSTTPYFIIVDKGSMHVILYDKYGIETKSYLCACSRHYGAKHKFRDNRTPEGFFSAEGIYDSRTWLYTNDNGYTSPAKGVYGPRFIRLQTPVTRSVGIHGTNSPNSPGKRCSHGCIRILNKNILELVKYAQKGMPIIVNPSAKDDAVNKKEGYKDIVMLSLGKIKASEGTEYEPAKDAAKPDSAKKATTTQEETKTEATETPAETPAPAEPAPAPAPAPAAE